MQRAVTILSLVAVACIVGVVICVRLYIAQSNARKTERARAASLESKANKKTEPKTEPVQKDLFSSDDVTGLNDSN